MTEKAKSSKGGFKIVSNPSLADMILEQKATIFVMYSILKQAFY